MLALRPLHCLAHHCNSRQKYYFLFENIPKTNLRGCSTPEIPKEISLKQATLNSIACILALITALVLYEQLIFLKLWGGMVFVAK